MCNALYKNRLLLLSWKLTASTDDLLLGLGTAIGLVGDCNVGDLDVSLWVGVLGLPLSTAEDLHPKKK